MSFTVYQCQEWQCRYVFPDKACCIRPIGHDGEHSPAVGAAHEPPAMSDREITKPCRVCGGDHPAIQHGDLARRPMVELAMPSDARLTDSEVGKASGSATESDLRTAIAHLTEERDRETALRRKAEAHVKSLQAALDQKPYANEYDDLEAKLAALTEAHERLRTALREAIDGYAASHKYDHGEWHFDHNDLPSEGCPECQAHRDVIAKWESALLSPREGTIATDRGDKDLGLPGSAATKGL